MGLNLSFNKGSGNPQIFSIVIAQSDCVSKIYSEIMRNGEK